MLYYITYFCLQIWRKHRFFFVVDLFYTKVKGKYCYDGRYGEYATLKEAQTACFCDKNCSKIYDGGCDGAGKFSLCPKKSTEKQSSMSSCVYIKQKCSTKGKALLVIPTQSINFTFK